MGKRVLLVDDDIDLQFLTRLALNEAGFDVVTVANGREAILQARAGGFDVILMDAEMPVMNGYEAYHELLSDPVTSAIPVVFLTAKLPEERVDYILKPFDTDQLPDQILKILAMRNS
jgi:two-component system response regulator AtoC